MEWAILADVPPPARRQILSGCRRRRYPAGQALFHDGDPSDGMHLVACGHVLVQVSTPLGDVATVAVLGPGEAVGEQSLLEHHGHRTASAVALDPVESLYLGRLVFDELRAGHPDIDRFLVSLLDARLRAVTDQLLAALYLPADARVFRCLRQALTTFGGEVIPLSQDDIASMAGTTRPTANRILRRAEADGAVRLGRRQVTVVDRQALDRLG